MTPLKKQKLITLFDEIKIFRPKKFELCNWTCRICFNLNKVVYFMYQRPNLMNLSRGLKLPKTGFNLAPA